MSPSSNSAALGPLVVVPMLKDDELIGAITIYRQEVRPFTDKQIELVRTSPRRPSSPSRTPACSTSCANRCSSRPPPPTCSRSSAARPSICKTVLQTLVESAARLCDADQATITRQKDGVFYRAEAYGFPPEFIDMVQRRAGQAGARLDERSTLLEGKVVHVPDVLADPDYTLAEAQRLGRYRTMLGVPMLREGMPIGVLTLTRSEVRPFTDKQIELVIDLRRPSGDRDRERAAVRRDPGQEPPARRWRASTSRSSSPA